MIRERIALACNSEIEQPPSPQEMTQTQEEKEEIKIFFNSVSNGSASAFSLKVISGNYELLSAPLDTRFMSMYKMTTLCTSRFGKEYADAVLEYKEKISYCTLIEYASLIGEHGVVASLLAGGINPCHLREEGAKERNEEVSQLVMQKLVADLVPSSLAVYIINSIYVMKMWSVVKSNDGESGGICPLCSTMSTEPLLAFQASCNHECCELCMWDVILQHLDNRPEGDVVRCPTCEASCINTSCIESEDANDGITPLERYNMSLELFQAMPKNASDLKKLPKKAKAKNAIHSSWYSALLPTTGGSQDVRSDKFVRYVNTGAVHHSHACLRAGIDVNMTNEYNQSELFILVHGTLCY